MKMNQKNKPWLFVGVALVFVAGLASLWLTGSDEAIADPAAMAPPPMPVAALQLTTGAATVYESLPGRVAARQIAEVRPQVSGILQQQLFTEGGYVKEGAPLYQIDPAPYEAAHRSALASLEKAKANLLAVEVTTERFEKLILTSAVSQQEYEDNKVRYAQAQADLSIAKAALAQAKIQLEFTRVNAPISGHIGKSQVTKGALVTANQAASLATITQINPIYVDMVLPGSSLNYLRSQLGSINNIPVVIFAAENNEQNSSDVKNIVHRGSLKFHEITLDPGTSGVQLRAEFPNENMSLLPGMFVRAALQLDLSGVMLVPQKAAQRQQNGSLSVWVVGDDGSVSAKPFVEERALGDQWIVQSGLNSGEVIVIEGMMKLQPGAKVQPQFAQTETSAAPAQAQTQNNKE